MLKTTVGQLLVNEALPESMRDYSRVIDKKGLSDLLRDLALKHPDQYVAATKRLADVGRTVATRTGGNSFGLAHLNKSKAAREVEAKLRARIKEVLDGDDDLDEKGQGREQRIIEAVSGVMKTTPDAVYEESLKEGNPLAYQVLSGSRGNRMNLNELRGTGLLYSDHRGSTLPLPILRSFSEGQSPIEYWAGTYGARKGVLSTKFATQEAGYLCLARGTLVRMSDGSSKPVEDVAVGDTVFAVHDNGCGNIVCEKVAVTATFRNGPKKCVRAVFRTSFHAGRGHPKNYEIVCTPDHKILSDSIEWDCGVKQRPVGCDHIETLMALVATSDPLEHVTPDGLMTPWVATAVRASVEDVGEIETFDIEVGHPDHLFLLDNGMVVSNSKQLNQINHRLVVTDDDDPRDIPDRGMPVDTDDPDSEGSLLARDVAGYKKNTPLTPKILRHIRSQGFDRILVRSPIIGGSPDGGIYARDAGVREKGTLAGRFEQIGLQAAQSLSEPLSQAQLGAKHTGGVAGADKSLSGFKQIDQQVQVPNAFKGGAAHAELDGTVDGVADAPAGGKFVTIGGKQHHVPQGYAVTVKPGDRVEAGDTLSEGASNPAMATKYKGIGEGRRQFVYSMMRAMKNAGLKANRRNVEVLARGLINHVRLTEEWGDHLPDDVVPYSTLEHLYQPREGHAVLAPERAVNKYLERPVLHYTIGTKVRPSMLKDFQAFGVKEIAAHDQPPPFEPEMVRGMNSLRNDPDWMTRMYGSGLKAGLLDSVHRGGSSDRLGTSFVPSLAVGVGFGRQGAVQQPVPGAPLPPEGSPFPALGKSAAEGADRDASGVKPPAAPKPFFRPESVQPIKPIKAPEPQTPAWMSQPREDVTDFVTGGGTTDDPNSGHGGAFGQVTRLGTLIAPDAVGALTAGRHYTPTAHPVRPGAVNPGRRPGAYPGVPGQGGDPGGDGTAGDGVVFGGGGGDPSPAAPAGRGPYLSFQNAWDFAKEQPYATGVGATAALGYGAYKGVQLLKPKISPPPVAAPPGAAPGTGPITGTPAAKPATPGAAPGSPPAQTWGAWGKNLAKGVGRTALTALPTLGLGYANEQGAFGEQNKEMVRGAIGSVMDGQNVLSLASKNPAMAGLTSAIDAVSVGAQGVAAARSDGGLAKHLEDSAVKDWTSFGENAYSGMGDIFKGRNVLGGGQKLLSATARLANPATNLRQAVGGAMIAGREVGRQSQNVVDTARAGESAGEKAETLNIARSNAGGDVPAVSVAAPQRRTWSEWAERMGRSPYEAVAMFHEDQLSSAARAGELAGAERARNKAHYLAKQEKLRAENAKREADRQAADERERQRWLAAPVVPNVIPMPSGAGLPAAGLPGISPAGPTGVPPADDAKPVTPIGYGLPGYRPFGPPPAGYRPPAGADNLPIN